MTPYYPRPCVQYAVGGKRCRKMADFFFSYLDRSRIFSAACFGEWRVLILDLMCTVRQIRLQRCSRLKWMSVKCHGERVGIIRELVTAHCLVSHVHTRAPVQGRVASWKARAKPHLVFHACRPAACLWNFPQSIILFISCCKWNINV